MPMLRSMRLLNSIEAGTTNAAALQTLLADAGRLSEWSALLSMRSMVRRIAVASTSVNAIAGSARAAEGFFTANTYVGKWFETLLAVKNPTLAALNTLEEVVSNSTAMTAIAGNSTAMTAIASSLTAKLAVFESDTALGAIVASSTALAACRAAPGYAVTSWTENSTSAVSIPLPGSKYIVLGASRGGSYSNAHTYTTVRSGSAISGTSPTINISGTTATDVNAAIPIVAPFTARGSTYGIATGYIGLLRCDI